MMKQTIKLGWVLVLAVIAFSCCSCEPISTGGDDDDAPVVVYTRYNLHHYLTKGQYKAGYPNYVNPPGHGFLPYNTKVTIGSYRLGFKVVVEETDMEIFFEFKSKNMGGMSTDEYIELITSAEPVSYDQLPAVDQDGIQAGKVTPGMCKEGVMAAWGYPAKHRTPSLDANLWYYWQNRMATVGVQFGADGKVSNVVK